MLVLLIPIITTTTTTITTITITKSIMKPGGSIPSSQLLQINPSRKIYPISHMYTHFKIHFNTAITSMQRPSYGSIAYNIYYPLRFEKYSSFSHTADILSIF